MRSDMAKVIVERPRIGGGFRYPRGSQSDGPSPELWRTREGMKRHWIHWNTQKQLNENLAPLWRFLRSRLGRPWDKIYSEVCERINKNSAVQLHVWQHLMEQVVTDPHKISGDVNCSRFRWGAFYVDPKTGLLREKKPAPRWRRTDPRSLDRVKIDATREYRRLDGLWYELTLEPLPASGQFYDVALKQYWFAGVAATPHFQQRYGHKVYATRKRQLNTKEIRRLPAPS